MKTPPTASTVYTTSKQNTTVTMTRILLIVLGLQHDPDPETPHYLPLLRKDLHQEEDQKKSLNPHLDLIVDLIFRLEYTHVCTHQQDIHHT